MFSCINSTNVHLCNYCSKTFVIVLNTCVCRRSVDNKAVILSYPILSFLTDGRQYQVITLNLWYHVLVPAFSFSMKFRYCCLQVLKNYFPRISRILLLCFENCWHKFPTIKSPRDFEDENFPVIISPTKEAFDYIYLFIYLFIY